jgi:pantetheine-phosphate adenylyltransferase
MSESFQPSTPAAPPHIHAVYPGSFDPPTSGHLDIIRRAAAIFPRLTVSVVMNPQKRNPMFTLEEREQMLRDCTSNLDNVAVERFSGLLASYVRQIEADVIVKGLRVVSDFESEMAVAQLNQSLSGVDTLFLIAMPAYTFISSSMVKEAFLLGADVEAFVPSIVAKMLSSKRISQP